MSRCRTCRHFDNAPDSFEHAFPGLTSFSSGNASVRDEDGVCRLHERHVSQDSGCGRYEPGGPSNAYRLPSGDS
jgi:hypothetical protein